MIDCMADCGSIGDVHVDVDDAVLLSRARILVVCVYNIIIVPAAVITAVTLLIRVLAVVALNVGTYSHCGSSVSACR